MAALPFIVGLALVAAFAPQVDAATPTCTAIDTPMCDTTCRITGWCYNSIWRQGATCPAGQVCDDTTTSNPTCVTPVGPTGCTGGSGAPPPGTTFCTEVGKFPTLTDCTAYFDCTAGLVGSPVPSVSCPAGTYFNSCLRDCAAGGTCFTNASAVCTGLTSYRGVDPNNNALYYDCLVGQFSPNIYPNWHSCNSGQLYSIVSGKCLSMSGCSPCTGVATVPISTTTCSYAYCYGRGNFEERSCTRGFHYDASYRGCVSGGCT